MKLKEGFLLRQVAGQNVAVPVAAELDLNGMITLNDTGAFLWKLLEQDTTEEALVSALLAEYDVDREKARKAVAAFVQKLRDNGFLAEV